MEAVGCSSSLVHAKGPLGHPLVTAKGYTRSHPTDCLLAHPCRVLVGALSNSDLSPDQPLAFVHTKSAQTATFGNSVPQANYKG